DLEEVFRLQKRKLGPKHPDTLGTAFSLVLVYLSRGRVAEAVHLSEQTLKLRREVYGPDHPLTLRSMNQLGIALMRAGRVPEAQPLLEEALRLHRVKLGPEHHMTLESLDALAQAHLAAKQPEKAVRLLEESLTILEHEEPNSRRTWYTRLTLGTALVGQKRYPEAESLLLRVVEGLQRPDVRHSGERNAGLTKAVEQLILLYDAWAKPDKATEWRKRLDEEKKKT